MGEFVTAAEVRLRDRMTHAREQGYRHYVLVSYVLPTVLAALALGVAVESYRPIALSWLTAGATIARIFGGPTAGRIAVGLVFPATVWGAWQVQQTYCVGTMVALIALCFAPAGLLQARKCPEAPAPGPHGGLR